MCGRYSGSKPLIGCTELVRKKRIITSLIRIGQTRNQVILFDVSFKGKALGLIHSSVFLGRITSTYRIKRRIEVITENSFQAFGESLRGELIQPDDQGYDIARKLYNGMIDRPATGDRLLPDLLMPDRFATYAQTRGIDP